MSVDGGSTRRKGLARRRVFTTLASLVRIVAAVFALILVVYVVFVVGKANPENWLVALVSEWAGGLTLGLDDLFEPADPTLRVVVDFGVPAIVWLLIGALLGRLLRRFAS